MANVLQQVLNGVRQDRTKDVIPLRQSQFTNPSGGKMSRALNRGGNPLDRLARSSDPTSGPALANAIRRLPQEEEFMEGQRLYNNRQVINRDIEPLGPHLDSISTYELGILHRGETPEMGALIRIRDFRTVRDRPSNIITPANYNYEIALRQYDLFQASELDEYAKRCPQDWWCREWGFDGVMAENNTHDSAGRGPPPSGVLSSRKDATIIGKGPQACYNYWVESGDDLQPGSHLFALIKKTKCPAHYVLNNRYNQALDGFSADRELPQVSTDGGNVNFRPFQMCFLALPPDTPYPSMRDLEYVDEWGRQRWDTQVIYVGRAHFVPRRAQMTALTRQTHMPQSTHRQLQPYSDANVGVSSRDVTMLWIIMNSDDGICPV